MARTRRFPQISPAEAYAALRWLTAQGKIRAADIGAALRNRERLVAEIRQRLEALSSEGLRTLKDGPFPTRAAMAVGRPRKLRLTPARRAQLRLQGRYLAAVRPLSKANRAKVKAIHRRKGAKAAIVAARRFGKGR